ncbi:hypothetical protein [Abyssisolibacter fermentans]|uniref:hypothetical protein n=1 Tax=Abyssisolibacter fermentans TaxID=1766203 RepID=UPI0012E3879F|nr:hypothetical protein [Abyssisolibacter fermentans]
MLSQIACVKEDIFYKNYNKSKHPKDTEFLIVNTSQSITSYINKVVEYIKHK